VGEQLDKSEGRSEAEFRVEARLEIEPMLRTLRALPEDKLTTGAVRKAGFRIRIRFRIRMDPH
jgi:hypothetical protein